MESLIWSIIIFIGSLVGGFFLICLIFWLCMTYEKAQKFFTWLGLLILILLVIYVCLLGIDAVWTGGNIF